MDNCQVGLVLKKRPDEHGELAEDDDDDDCHFYSTILTPHQTAAIVKMIKQVAESTVNYSDIHHHIMFSWMTTWSWRKAGRRRRSKRPSSSSTSCWGITRSSTWRSMSTSTAGDRNGINNFYANTNKSSESLKAQQKLRNCSL